MLRYYALVDGLADEAGMFAAAGKMAASGELEEFRTYVMSYVFLASQLCSWDAPELLGLGSRPQDLSAYITRRRLCGRLPQGDGALRRGHAPD